MPSIAPEPTPAPEPSRDRASGSPVVSSDAVGSMTDAAPAAPPCAQFPPARLEVGAPSPREAWAPMPEAPSWLRQPAAFWNWFQTRHRETLADNPIFIKSIRRGYVKRPSLFSPWVSDFILGFVFTAVGLLLIALIWKVRTGRIPVNYALYYLLVTGGIYLLSTLLSGLSFVLRVNRFLDVSDKGMVWGDLILSPLREDHYLWAWVWSPLIERLHHVILAVVITAPAILMASPLLNGNLKWDLSQIEAWHYVHLLLMATASVCLVAILGLLISIGTVLLGLAQSLNLAPRLHNLVGFLLGLFPVLILSGGILFALTAAALLIAGLFGRENQYWFTLSLLYSAAGLVFAAWADWIIFHNLRPHLWNALVDRCSPRGHKSWWQTLLSKE